ncbi:hypothetical protein [Tahibacter caeni]|uniref:hypothetical protein n=1 Tax=Tahibacter caeni TaxID=1453545 RepID=UPI0021485953|nr:hypothetical protein [Tahibacter caeni]
MKIYGRAAANSNDAAPSALVEAALCATPDELRRIAAFLTLCADELEYLGERYGHLHLADRMSGFGGSPTLTVFAAESGSA